MLLPMHYPVHSLVTGIAIDYAGKITVDKTLYAQDVIHILHVCMYICIRT